MMVINARLKEYCVRMVDGFADIMGEKVQELKPLKES
jgi:hypothetical protein